MNVKSKILLSTAALFCAMPGSVLAGSHVNSVWIVDPSMVSGEAKSLAPGEMLVTTRLLPPALAVLTDSVADPGNSNFPIPAGTQLFGTLDGSIWNPKAATSPVYCEIKGFVAEASRRSRGDIVVRRCLIDREGDGRFDGIFSTYSCQPEFPNIANFDVPKNAAAIAARYRPVASAQIADGPRVGIVFDGFNYMNGSPRFFRTFGNGKPIPAFGRLSQKQVDPGIQELFGAQFAILDRGSDRVKVQLKKAIPAQAFAMLGGGPCLG